MELTAENVEKVLMYALFREGEPTEPRVEARGIVQNMGFHPERLKSHREDVRSMLEQLPENFRESGGGGWSFLCACNRADGAQWGEHQSMENLMLLGIGLGLWKWMMPREMWDALPGGMPYGVFLDKQPAGATP